MRSPRLEIRARCRFSGVTHVVGDLIKRVGRQCFGFDIGGIVVVAVVEARKMFVEVCCMLGWIIVDSNDFLGTLVSGQCMASWNYLCQLAHMIGIAEVDSHSARELLGSRRKQPGIVTLVVGHSNWVVEYTRFEVDNWAHMLRLEHSMKQSWLGKCFELMYSASSNNYHNFPLLGSFGSPAAEALMVSN